MFCVYSRTDKVGRSHMYPAVVAGKVASRQHLQHAVTSRQWCFVPTGGRGRMAILSNSSSNIGSISSICSISGTSASGIDRDLRFIYAMRTNDG